DFAPAFWISAQIRAKIPRQRVGKTIARNLLTTVPIKPQSTKPLRIKRLKRQVKLLHILERKFVLVRNTCCTCFGVKPIRERFAQRVNAPTRTRACFEDSYIMSEFGEFVSSNKPGHSSAQNEHLFGRAT